MCNICALILADLQTSLRKLINTNLKGLVIPTEVIDVLVWMINPYLSNATRVPLMPINNAFLKMSSDLAMLLRLVVKDV